MNYETYREHLNNLLLEIEDLKDQLKMEEQEKEPIYEIGQYSFTRDFEDYLDYKIYSRVDDNGEKKYATPTDLLNALDQLMYEYENLNNKYLELKRETREYNNADEYHELMKMGDL